VIASAAASVLLMRGQSPSSHKAYKFFTPPNAKPQNNPGGAFADSSSHHAPAWGNN